MVDQTPAPAAPVEAPAAAPLEVVMADPNAMVEFRTARGDTQIVPVSSLLKDAQVYESGRQLMAEAKEKLRDMNLDTAHAQRYREQEELVARNPDEYAAAALRRATLAKGSPLAISSQQNTNSEDEATPDARHTSATEQRLARVEANQHQILADQQQASVKSEVNEALGEFPVFQDPARAGLRSKAEMVLLAAKAFAPSADLRAVARDFHSTLVKELGVQRTAVRDAREERAATMPAISPQAGSPDAKALEGMAPPKAADLKSGAWGDRGRAFLAKLAGNAGV